MFIYGVSSVVPAPSGPDFLWGTWNARNVSVVRGLFEAPRGCDFVERTIQLPRGPHTSLTTPQQVETCGPVFRLGIKGLERMPSNFG
jgi:hypothetical protein